MRVALTREQVLATFWDLVDKSENEGNHWFWRGKFRLLHNHKLPWLSKGRAVHDSAARLAWELTFGTILPETTLHRQCDEPICVNPGHFRQRRPVPMRGRPRTGIYPSDRQRHVPTVVMDPPLVASPTDLAAAVAQRLEREGSPLLEALPMLRQIGQQVTAVASAVRDLKMAVAALEARPVPPVPTAEQRAEELRLAVLAALQEAQHHQDPDPEPAAPTSAYVAPTDDPNAGLRQVWEHAGFPPLSCPEDGDLLGQAFDAVVASAPAQESGSCATTFLSILMRYRELVDAGLAEPSPAGLLLAIDVLIDPDGYDHLVDRTHP